jgi:hypothetical protein
MLHNIGVLISHQQQIRRYFELRHSLSMPTVFGKPGTISTFGAMMMFQIEAHKTYQLWYGDDGVTVQDQFGNCAECPHMKVQGTIELSSRRVAIGAPHPVTLLPTLSCGSVAAFSVEGTDITDVTVKKQKMSCDQLESGRPSLPQRDGHGFWALLGFRREEEPPAAGYISHGLDFVRLGCLSCESGLEFNMLLGANATMTAVCRSETGSWRLTGGFRPADLLWDLRLQYTAPAEECLPMDQHLHFRWAMHRGVELDSAWWRQSQDSKQRHRHHHDHERHEHKDRHEHRHHHHHHEHDHETRSSSESSSSG